MSFEILASRLFLPVSVAAVVAAVVLTPVAAASEEVPAVHGIAMHGTPALPEDFAHLPYVNPDAPKGGSITHGFLGSFDSMNQYIVQGGTSSARGIQDVELGNLVIESLMVRNENEPFSLYGLIAESVRLPDSRDWIEFTLNPAARFSDGKPVTVDDVIFTIELLRDKGRPVYRERYRRIERIERTGERTVKFVFANGSDRELPLLVALSPVFPRHTINPETFDRSTLKAPVGSGPYVVAKIDPGTSVVFRRNPDYWARDLPIKRGQNNFDEIRVEYYRDENSLMEAFKKGILSVLTVSDPKRWTTDLDFPAVRDGKVVKDAFPLSRPADMTGFALNTRRPVFSDLRVRKALSMLFDFEWVNRNLYYGAYARTGGFFDGSQLSSIGRPADERERSLLAPFPNTIEPAVMDGTWRPVETDGTGRDRSVMRQAVALLREAGYDIRDGRMVAETTGDPLTFEILVLGRDQERLAIAYQRMLRLVGIEADVRSVEAAQYQKRRQTFDFDMMLYTLRSSLSPGNEQAYRWSSAAAGAEGSFNYPGVRNPAADAMIEALLAARSQEDFVSAVRAFDRVLISGHYVVPLFHLPEQWAARWTRVDHPETQPITGYRFDTWWAVPRGG